MEMKTRRFWNLISAILNHLKSYLIKILLIVGFGIIIAVLCYGLYDIWFLVRPDAKVFSLELKFLTTQIGISIILIWFMILFPYLAWAVYFYNINEGKTRAEWNDIRKDKIMKQSLGMETEGPSEARENKNPYKNETFGLPKGTIRGTIAITLMVGALALFIVAIGQPDILRNNEFFHENFEFFKTAFLMMIAFYFGSKSLEHLRERWKIDKGSPSGGGSGGSPTGGSPGAASPSILPSAPNQPKQGDQGPSTTSSPSGSPSAPSEPTSSAPTKISVSDMLDEENDELESSSQPQEPSANVRSLLIPKEGENEKQKDLTEEDIQAEADSLGVELAAVKAVIAVESAGDGFLHDGRPKILFEGHIFWKQLEKKGGFDLKSLATVHPDIVYEKWTSNHYLGGSREYTRYRKASRIDEDSAKMATSWGMFQIMGFNHKVCGFSKVSDFVEAMETSEHEQLKAFVKFIQSKNLDDALKNHHWAKFARGYNGPGYAKNQYDLKLEEKYNEFSKEHNTEIEVHLKREVETDRQTLGELFVMENAGEVFKCKTLELPYKDNRRNVSCIPSGEYTVKKRWSEKYKDHFHVQSVPNRSFILIHSGNFYNHTLGCILVGQDHIDINNDGYSDVNYSKATMGKLLDILPNQFQMTIKA